MSTTTVGKIKDKDPSTLGELDKILLDLESRIETLEKKEWS